MNHKLLIGHYIPNFCKECGSRDWHIYIVDGKITIFKCRDCKAGWNQEDIEDYYL